MSLMRALSDKWLAVGLALPALIVAAALKLWIVAVGHVPFNSDEAIVALMARHILAGERPLFFYGQAYLGSLDAVLIAIGFRFFGQSVDVVRLVQGLLYLGTVGSVMLLARLLYSNWRHGVLVGWLLAVPTINVSLYTTASLGGYGEAMLIGTWSLILAWLATRTKDDNWVARLAWLWGVASWFLACGCLA